MINVLLEIGKLTLVATAGAWGHVGWKRFNRKHPRAQLGEPDPRCERVGSQQEFYRSVRDGTRDR